MVEVKLKVKAGKAAGQEIRLPGSKFIIGRAEDCHLRPNSDLVSRHHCAILCDEGFVVVREFGSKNGTYVNGNRIAGECELKTGDTLKVGPLEFDVVVTASAVPAAPVTAAKGATSPGPAAVTPAKKRPAVHSIKEAAARTAQNASAGNSGGSDIDEWLAEPATESTSQTVNIRDAETEEIALGGTMSIPAMPTLPVNTPPVNVDPGTDAATIAPDAPTREISQSGVTPATPAAPKPMGKMPPAAPKGKDSGSAAAETLRKFFNRR
ncbi:MAG: FHA domain-containing protein [Pirellulales bacterium]|nr:FHA domain-containing protein [Pirellulales bacterium]